MSKKRLGNCIRAVLFLVLLSAMMLMAARVLSRPHALYWAEETGMDLVHRFRDDYDVVFSGTSIVIANVSNQQLYEQYGISGVSVGEPLQPLFLTRYVIREVLRYQHPKVVVVDARSLFYSEDGITERIMNNEEGIVHYALDSIRSLTLKKEALDQVRDQYREISYKSYFSRLYDKHSEWKQLDEAHFRGYGWADCMNGNVMMTNLHEINGTIGIDESINPKNEEVLCLIKEECEKQGTDLLLMTGYIDPNQSRLDQLREMAKRHQIDYIDINENLGRLQFTEDQMVSDYIHFNVLGAARWTDYIGEYLTERYSFEAHSEKLDSMFRSQSAHYGDYMEYFSRKQALTPNCSFKAYLEKLRQYGPENISIFVAVYDEAYYMLDDEGKSALKKLGLDGPSAFREGFAGACTPDGTEQARSLMEKVSVHGQTGSMTYTVESAGADAAGGARASIVVDGTEYATGQRGFNIVVFDNHLGKMISSKCFDTYSEANPADAG